MAPSPIDVNHNIAHADIISQQRFRIGTKEQISSITKTKRKIKRVRIIPKRLHMVSYSTTSSIATFNIPTLILKGKRERQCFISFTPLETWDYFMSYGYNIFAPEQKAGTTIVASNWIVFYQNLPGGKIGPYREPSNYQTSVNSIDTTTNTNVTYTMQNVYNFSVSVDDIYAAAKFSPGVHIYEGVLV